MARKRKGDSSCVNNPKRQRLSKAPLKFHSQRQRWVQLLRSQNYQALITEVLKKELPKYAGSNILPTLLSSTVRECINILASASSVFTAAVNGTLAQRIHTDPQLQHQNLIIQERANIQPSIYIHLLVNSQGTSPTPNQYSLIRETILQYLSSGSQYHDLAHQIDNITPPSISPFLSYSGHRKYLWTSHRSPQHTETISRFCDGIARRVSETALTRRNLPMEFPPTECGYSVNSPLRLAQHRNRQSSNYVMNLVEDVCGYLHQIGKLSHRFSMHPFIIYLIFRPEQAAIAEIFCSRLLQVWTEGGGLNAYPAGRSVASARRVSGECWGKYEGWARENTGLEGGLRVQRGRVEEDLEGLEWEVEEVWRDALDSDDGDDSQDGDYVPERLMESLGNLRLGGG